MGVFPYVAPFAGVLSASSTPTPIVKSLASQTITGISLQTTDAQPTSLTSTATPKTNVGAIVGGVVSGVFALLGAVAIVLFCLRRRRQGATDQEHITTTEPNEGCKIDSAVYARPDVSELSEKHGIDITTMSCAGQGRPPKSDAPAELPGTELHTHELLDTQRPTFEMSVTL